MAPPATKSGSTWRKTGLLFGGSHEKGSGVSNAECRSGNIMNLASCQTSEDDWLVVGHTGLKSSRDTWTGDVEFRMIVEF